MRPWIALLAVVPACGFSSDNPADGGRDDAAVDASYCYGNFPRVCLSSEPSVSRMFSEPITDIDTDTSELCDPQSSPYCVVASAVMAIGSGKTITARGSKPLVLLSTSTFTLDGEIDVSSSRTGPQAKGPGANPPSCVPGAGLGTSGGAGGSFGGRGGNGSTGDPANGLVGSAMEVTAEIPGALRGGCPGGAGGLGAEGSGGNGGGAIAIIATTIRLDGKINASGAGGAGGSSITSGGGGGGSGGMIVLDTATLQIENRAVVWANGGGGGQGGAVGMPGTNGKESVTSTSIAVGGDGVTDGARGGNGSAGLSLIGAPGQNNARAGGGGGGGGGGAGFVRAAGLSGDAVSPPPR